MNPIVPSGMVGEILRGAIFQKENGPSFLRFRCGGFGSGANHKPEPARRRGWQPITLLAQFLEPEPCLHLLDLDGRIYGGWIILSGRWICISATIISCSSIGQSE